MNSSTLCLLLFLGQLAVSKNVVRLPPGETTISQAYGGKSVELLNAPAEVRLPALKPSEASSLTGWSVNLKNLGPRDVTIHDASRFSFVLHPNESTTVVSRGSSSYVRLR
jgi:hypothetical protein